MSYLGRKVCSAVPPGFRDWDEYVDFVEAEYVERGEVFDYEEFCRDTYDDYLLDRYGL